MHSSGWGNGHACHGHLLLGLGRVAAPRLIKMQLIGLCYARLATNAVWLVSKQVLNKATAIEMALIGSSHL
jgi:hypothetical protein